MATSHYFQNYSSVGKLGEQRLFEDLINESIKINGHDVYYMPRESWEDTDRIYGENIYSRFERAYQMEMYIANVEGFEGDGEFFSKFGLEIRDTTNIVVTKRTFDKYIPSTITIRPREGDLIYVPLFQKIFEIKFVEEELLFFTRGKSIPYIYELRAEAFRYANEPMNTGVDVVDKLEELSTYTVTLTLSGSGNYNIGETVYQGANLSFATSTATVQNWFPANNTIVLITPKGNISASGNLVGASSGTTRTVTTADVLGDGTYYDLYNNKDIAIESNNFIDLSEINPFGLP